MTEHLQQIEGLEAPATDYTPMFEVAETVDGALKTLPFSRPKGPLSRKERRALRKELNARKREITKEARELSKADKALQRQERAKNKSIQDQLKESQKADEKKSKAILKKRDRAKDACTFIGYQRMFRDGICEVLPGLFSQSIEFPDISYQSAREDRQKAIMAVIWELLNYFPADANIQFNVVNVPILKEEIGRREFISVDAQETEATKEDARIFNKVLNTKMREGVSNIKRTRVLTYSVKASSVDAAIPSLARIRTDITKALGDIGCVARVMDGKRRLDMLHSQIHPEHRFDYDYDRDITAFSGLTTKDCIAPELLDFKPNGSHAYFANEDIFGQVLVIRKFGSDNSDKFISDLADLPMPLNISWHLLPMGKSKSVQYVKQRINWIDKEVIEEQRKASKQGYDPNLLPPELTYSRDEAGEVLDDLLTKNQSLFTFTGLVYTYAKSVDELNEQVKHIVDKANSHSVTIETLPMRQRQGLNSVLPLGYNTIDVSRIFTTAEAGILVPFATQELDQEGGIYVGQNKVSNNLVIANRRLNDAPMGFIAGKPGSGKSYFVKQEILGTYLTRPTDQVIIIDRAGEYVPIAEHLDGTVLSFGVDSDTHLNPFDLTTLSEMSHEAQVSFKADAMLAQAAASAAEGGSGIDEAEKSIIDRAVTLAFNKAKRRKNKIPTLQDFYDVLLDEEKCPEPQARTIALRYERYVNGSMNFFNNHSNIDWSKRIIDVNLRSLPDSMVVFALINICEAIRNQIYSNNEKGIRTWVYIEEIQSMFEYPMVLSYFSRFFKEARKFGGIITGITQNSVAMLREPEAETIVLNSDYIMLLKQSAADRAIWEKFVDLSAEESECIGDTCQRGDGLLLAGAARVPIKGNFPTDNAIYELFSTDFNERAAA